MVHLLSNEGGDQAIFQGTEFDDAHINNDTHDGRKKANEEEDKPAHQMYIVQHLLVKFAICLQGE